VLTLSVGCSVGFVMPRTVLLPTQRDISCLPYGCAPRRCPHPSQVWGCAHPPGKEVWKTLCHHIAKVASLAAAEVFKGATCLTIRRACRVRSSQPTFVYHRSFSAGCSWIAPRWVSRRGTPLASAQTRSRHFARWPTPDRIPWVLDVTRSLTHSARPFGHPTTTR
jgi:hypothetical protein